MTRREARTIAMQAIFQMERQAKYERETIELLLSEHKINKKQQEYIDACIENFMLHRDEIDELINDSCEHWDISRLARTDLAILRLAVTEMKYIDDVPVAVAVNEAVEMAKEYGTEKSPSFINGVLGKISGK